MLFNNDEAEVRINALTKEDWKPLLDLVPEIEKTEKFSEFIFDKKTPEDYNVMPYYDYGPVVFKFLKAVYDIPIIINFSWSSWEEGRNILKNKDFNFDTLDLVTKCRLITAIVRNDRFCEGVLADAFKSGLMLKILKSIEKDIQNKK